jgi:hypothetical protein
MLNGTSDEEKTNAPVVGIVLIKSNALRQDTKSSLFNLSCFRTEKYCLFLIS